MQELALTPLISIPESSFLPCLVGSADPPGRTSSSWGTRPVPSDHCNSPSTSEKSLYFLFRWDDSLYALRPVASVRYLDCCSDKPSQSLAATVAVMVERVLTDHTEICLADVFAVAAAVFDGGFDSGSPSERITQL